MGLAVQSVAAWRQALVIVTPATVLSWQRRRFHRYWVTLSGRPRAGRPPVDAAIKALVRRMAVANPLWGAPRIHGELLKLGIDVAERTVSRLLPKRRSPPSQTWRAFLSNHVWDLVSVDFFTVPTARMRVLFVLVVLAHLRRRVVHFNITEHPTASWDRPANRGCLPGGLRALLSLRDRDRVFGEQFRHRLKGMGITEVLTAPHSPWQNPYDLRRILTRYFDYYHQARTHLALDKDAPDLRPIERPAKGIIMQLPEVGGLHHRYVRQAAQAQHRSALGSSRPACSPSSIAKAV